MLKVYDGVTIIEKREITTWTAVLSLRRIGGGGVCFKAIVMKLLYIYCLRQLSYNRYQWKLHMWRDNGIFY